LGLSGLPGPVGLVSERAETPRAPKKGIIQRFLQYVSVVKWASRIGF
jgi:hypothetical protein